MARYLTPARICTLVLLEAYQSEDFWVYDHNTSAVILQVILGQCLQPTDYVALDLAQLAALPRDVLEYGKPLASLGAELPGRSWLSTLVRDLWKIHTVDELHDLFERSLTYVVSPTYDTASHAIRPPTITRASPIGQFIRKCHVEYTRLQFSETLILWQRFVAYRAPSRAMWSQHYPELVKQAPSTLPQQDSHIDLETENRLVGSDTVDTILSASVSQLQKLGQRVPPSVQAKLETWFLAQQTPNAQALHHFMSFFDTWRAGQYSLALENLHRYFDYSVAKGAGDDMKVYYQYALLHLSVLHADFEHWDESVSAMKECIATARENQDTACLNFALSWLLFLRQSRHTRDSSSLRSLAAIAGEGGSERDEIAFLKAKARDGKHWSLMSSTVLEEAKFELRHNGICNKAVELVLQSSYLNVQHGLTSMLPITTTFQAAIFDRLGQAHLSRNLHISALESFTKQCSLAEHTRIVCRMAYDCAQQGQYRLSQYMLRELKPRVAGILKLEQRLTAFTELLALMLAIRRSDMGAAIVHSNNLGAVRDTADPDVAGSVKQQEIALLMKQRRHDTALEKLNGALARLEQQDESDVAEVLSLLIQKANVFAAAGQPRKGLTIALRAASTAQRCHLIVLLTEALNALAGIFNDLSKFEAARALSEAVLPHALESSNMSIVAHLFVTLGESYVGLVTSTPDASSTKQTQLAHMAASNIERAREVYEKLEDHEGQLDCLLMQARLARWSDDESSAERADAKYYQLIVEHQHRGHS